jgi:cytochrome c2
MLPSALPLVAAAGLLLGIAPVAARGDLREPLDARCRLGEAAGRLASDACLACHAAHGGHPVDLEYAVRAAYRARDLRSAREVVARGVFLPDGYLRCQTCHDARSPWKHRLALPPGAPVRPGVNPRIRASYTGQASGVPVAPGEAVTPTPLCRACHTIGD